LGLPQFWIGGTKLQAQRPSMINAPMPNIERNRGDAVISAVPTIRAPNARGDQ
jgi:hypothetical protein